MTRKGFILLVLTVFAAGSVFAQTDFATMAKNTIVLDTGPSIVGAAISKLGDMAGGDGLSTFGFGFAFQYERQISEKFTVAGRFAYLSGTMGITDTYNELGVQKNTTATMKLSSFSIEGHARYYPWGKTFFLDSMLGYANMSAAISGDMVATDGYIEERRAVSIKASQGFLKYGAKLGWRISFGKNGGFVFEPAFGYYGGFGFGNTIGKQLLKDSPDVDVSDFDKTLGIIENFIFIGGPRITLAFGYRF